MGLQDYAIVFMVILLWVLLLSIERPRRPKARPATKARLKQAEVKVSAAPRPAAGARPQGHAGFTLERREQLLRLAHQRAAQLPALQPRQHNTR